MKVLINEDKAKWVDGNENGRWQRIKENNKGRFITKGVELIYIDEGDEKKTRDSSRAIQIKGGKKPDVVELDTHELKIYHAYWESKYFWDRMFNDISDTDFYYYRRLCISKPKSFFLQFKKK